MRVDQTYATRLAIVLGILVVLMAATFAIVQNL
jgi:hypothetical protein